MLALAISIWLYALMTGLAPPVERAAMVATFALIGFAIGRKPDLVTLGVLVASATVVAAPAQLHQLSFQLSTAASIAIALVVSSGRTRKAGGEARAVVTASLAAQIATLPFLARTVGVPSAWSIVANILIAPLVPLMFALSMLVTMLSWVNASLAAGVGVVVVFIANAILRIVSSVASLPGATRSTQIGGIASAELVIAAAVLMIGGSRDARRELSRLHREIVTATSSRSAVAAMAIVGALVGAAIALSIR